VNDVELSVAWLFDGHLEHDSSPCRLDSGCARRRHRARDRRATHFVTVNVSESGWTAKTQDARHCYALAQLKRRNRSPSLKLRRDTFSVRRWRAGRGSAALR
jgi:hypothetical protein